jgi:hypothetical protein
VRAVLGHRHGPRRCARAVPPVMTEGADLRRIHPPPRRRPGLLAILVRWRVEILLLCALVSAWNAFGTRVIVIVVSMLLVVAAVYPPVRRAALLAWHLLAVPHRVRSAFVQAGVASRQGYLPWLFVASPAGIASVSVYVGLPSGTTVRDVREAVPVILTACGAERVEVNAHQTRADRLTVVVVRPQWGLLGSCSGVTSGALTVPETSR